MKVRSRYFGFAIYEGEEGGEGADWKVLSLMDGALRIEVYDLVCSEILLVIRSRSFED